MPSIKLFELVPRGPPACVGYCWRRGWRNGKPLFESAAIVTAIADLVPEKNLIAKAGTWSRNLHYQWVCFALTEMEPYVHSTEINSIDFVMPESQHVHGIIEQNIDDV
jgi:glutathione S-transferase